MELASVKNQLEWLKGQIGLARKHMFGQSSEQSRYDTEQILLGQDALHTPDQEVYGHAIELAKQEKKVRARKTRLVTDKLPDYIPTETIEHTLPEGERGCPECGDEMHPIGKETVREEIEIIPARIVLVKHVRTSYGCRTCETTAEKPTIVKPSIPEPVIKGSFASAKSIAYIMVQKFVMGLPLYRQESEWLRQGIGLSRQTMSNWLIKASEDWLAPIYKLLHKRILTYDHLMSDDTNLQVIKEPGRKAKQKSNIWVYRTGWGVEYPIVLCEYQPGRHGKHPKVFLCGFKGYLQVDGYPGYDGISDNITLVGCLVHIRRYFDNALKILPEADREGTEALRGKRYCDALFDIEKLLSDMSAVERYLWRIAFAKPVLDEFHEWLMSFANLGKSLFSKAVGYALGQWGNLTNYLLDGRLEASNNRTERVVKMYAINRKNFLFAYTPRGAAASATIFSMIQTAIENCLDPYKYLTYIFTNAPNWAIGDAEGFAARFLPEAVPDTLRASAGRLGYESPGVKLNRHNILLSEKEGLLNGKS